MSGTGDWHPGPLEEQVGLLGFQIGVWNHLGYAAPENGQAAIPPFGERKADAIRAGHGAIELIDEIVRDVYRLREQLVGELRTDAEVRGRRVDAMVAEARVRREAGGAR